MRKLFMMVAAIMLVTVEARATGDLNRQTDNAIQPYAGDQDPQQRELSARRVTWRHPEAQRAKRRALKPVQILSINDFHGQIEASKKVAGRPAGGAAVLTSYLDAAQAGLEDRTFIVHAGDFVGASPPASALLQDEPSIMFFNMIANGKACRNSLLNPRCNILGTVGNHEFDEGEEELMRLLRGGNHAQGPFLQAPWRGARFPHICANVIRKSKGKHLLPPFVIKNARGIKVGFIGAVLKETPSIVTASGVADLEFLDEADSINQFVKTLKARRVRTIVVLLHQGGTQTAYVGPTDPASGELSGAILDIVQRLDDEVDVVVSGHAHGFSNKLVPNANGHEILVTQAWSASTAYGDIDLLIDPATKDVMEKSAQIVTTWADEGPGLTPDPEVAQLVTAAQEAVAPLTQTVIAEAAKDILRTQNDAGESALGNLIADAQRAQMGTDFAFMNPGGIRADVYAGELTWGELYTVQPFNNYLVRMEMTGQQIYDLLNQQWAGQSYPRVLQISGLAYTWDDDRPLADRIVEVRKDGVAIDRSATYTVTVNSFLAGGGDNFSVMISGRNPVTGPIDLDALIEYLQAQPEPFDAGIEGRISRTARFAVFSDPHLYDGATLGTESTEFQAYLARDRKLIAESSEILTSVINDLKSKPFDFILVTGDLTKDGERINHEMMAARLAELEATGKKVFVVPGNHDINNPHALSYRTLPATPVANVSPAEFKEIYADFGYSEALFTDPNSLSYIAEPVPGVWLFALDSCIYSPTGETAGAFSTTTQQWVVDGLSDAAKQGKQVIGMMHHGIVEHYTGQSDTFPEYVIADWTNVAKLFSDNGLNVFFTGHYHANDITSKDFTSSVITDVETGSTVTYPCPYRMVDFDVPGNTFEIKTSYVTSIASRPDDFVTYAQDYLESGMMGIVGYQLSQLPYSLAEPTLSSVTGLVVPAFMAHYAGDETPDAATVATYMGMMESSDPVTRGLGQSLYSLWTDLEPLQDNAATLSIGSE